jgi:dihydrofolate reductase
MKLIYSAIASLDGYTEDESGGFQWAAPDEEVFAFVNDLERPVGTYLYGRRMYETMVYWETADRLTDPSPAEREFTDIWQAADKVVFSKTLGAVSSAKTRLEREFEPEAIRRLKATAEHDLGVAGADLAGQALAAGLVDELQLFSVPVLVGGGKRALPRDARADLELLEIRRFDSGFVFQRYAVKRDPGGFALHL